MLRVRVPVNVANLQVGLDATVADVISCIDRSGRTSIALLCDEQGRLLNTLSDGDIRRGILAGLNLTDHVDKLLDIKSKTPHPFAVTAPVGSDDAKLFDKMALNGIRQLPIIDGESRVVDVVTLGDFIGNKPLALDAVIMAGGFGKRLHPLTVDTPKPMLPIGGRPLIELIIEQLRHTGIQKINISTHFLAEKIIEHFGDGAGFGVELGYTNEQSPLGTAGALGLMARPANPFIVINGDIITDIDFSAMHAYHQDHHAKLTMAVRRYEVKVPYGVIETGDDARVTELREKPEVSFFVNAGIYLIDPDVYRFISPGVYLQMTDLITTMISAGEKVVSFPVREYWVDIGQPDDYERAQIDSLTRPRAPSL